MRTETDILLGLISFVYNIDWPEQLEPVTQESDRGRIERHERAIYQRNVSKSIFIVQLSPK